MNFINLCSRPFGPSDYSELYKAHLEIYKVHLEIYKVHVSFIKFTGTLYTRFTEEEEAAWSVQEEEHDEGTFMTPDFHGDVDFTTCFD